MCNDASDCCRTTAKVLLIIINIIFWLAGLLMLAFGIALVAAPDKVIGSLYDLGDIDFVAYLGDDFEDLMRACGIFMIVMGGVVAIIACFGFFGACCESRCMLITYAIILIIIVLAEVALIIFAAVFPDKFEKIGKKVFRQSLENNFKHDINSTDGSYGESGGVWNLIQWKLECCGVDGFGDYSNFTWTESYRDGKDATSGKQIVPLSCCKLKDSSKIPPEAETDYQDWDSCINEAKEASTNHKSCSNAAKDLIRVYSKIAIGIAAGIVGLELILIALAFILCCMWNDRSGKYV